MTTAPMLTSLLPFARKTHAVLGHTVGLLTVLLGLTGSVLAFRGEIERLLAPELYRVSAGPALPIEAVAEAVRAHADGRPLQRLTLPAGPGEPIEARVKGLGFVYVDPATGRVLGSQHPDTTFTGRVMDLHRHLMLGHNGSLVMASAAMGLIALWLGGLVLWLPRRGAARWRFALRKGPALRTRREAHLAIGLYGGLFLAAIAWTGIGFTHREAVTAFYGWLTFSDAKAVEPPRIAPGSTPAPFATLVALARREVPDGALRAVYFPAKGDRPLLVSFRRGHDPARNGSTLVYLDPYRARVVFRVRPETAPWAWRLHYQLNYAVHTGEIGGVPTRILAAGLGLLPAALYGTGLGYWLLKRRARRRAAAGRAAPASPAPAIAAQGAPRQ